jgi:hypothetical protein
VADVVGNLLVVKVYVVNIYDVVGGCYVYQVVKNKYLLIGGGCGDGVVVVLLWGLFGWRMVRWWICGEGKVEVVAGFVKVVVCGVDVCVGDLVSYFVKDSEIKVVYEECSFMISHLYTLLRHY